MEYAAFSSSGNGSSNQDTCGFCGRTFNPESLARHQPICQKSQAKKRRVFDSGRQRADGTDISVTKVQRPGQQVKNQPVKITNWRENHLEFVNSIRSARAAQKAIATGRPLPPPPPPSVNPNYIQCPHCQRRFNPSAGARHIPQCGDRTRLHGAPVKPLNKRAAADVGYSATGIRKAYDNKVVRKKSQNNPYAYAQPADVPPRRMYSAAYGGPGPSDGRQVIQSRRPNPPVSRHNSAPHRASLPNRNQHSANIQASPSSNHTQDGLTRRPVSRSLSTGQFDHHSTMRPGTQVAVGSSKPVRSAVAGSRPKSNRPKSGVRFADKLERVEGQDPPSPREPRPPSHPPPSYNQVQSPPTPPEPPYQTDTATSWYGNQGTYRTTRASEIRLQRSQMSSPTIRTSPRLSQESGSPRDDDKSGRYEVTTPLSMGQHTLPHRSNQYGTPPRSPNSPASQQSASDSPTQYQRQESSPNHRHTSESTNGHTKYPGSNGLHPRILASLDQSAGHLPAPFCFSCGTQFPVPDARFCCGCGIQRAFISEAPS